MCIRDRLMPHRQKAELPGELLGAVDDLPVGNDARARALPVKMDVPWFR